MAWSLLLFGVPGILSGEAKGTPPEPSSLLVEVLSCGVNQKASKMWEAQKHKCPDVSQWKTLQMDLTKLLFS